MKNMEWQQVLVTLSTLIIVAHGDDSCGSTPKKVTKTVRSHLRDTVHSVWKDDILEEQTKEMQAFFDKKIDEVKETFEDQLSQKDQVIDQNQEKITKLENELSENKQKMEDTLTQLTKENTEMQAFFNKKVDDMKESFENQLFKKDQVINQNQEKITELTQQINTLDSEMRVRLHFNKLPIQYPILTII